MVNQQLSDPKLHAKLDPVARRIAAAGEEHSASVLDWLTAHQSRIAMRRRAFLSALAGWAIVSAAAIVSAVVSFMFAANLRRMFGDDWLYESNGPWLAFAMPPIFGILAIIIVVGGIFAWIVGKFPGLGTTNSALDWAGTSDAVSRLLAVGCTYPEAFKTASEVAKTPGSRIWLSQAATRVEQGAPEVGAANASSGDAAIVELLIESSFAEPSRKWEIASEHFAKTAQQRLALLTTIAPILSTLVAGLLIWISISATVGWMWGSASSYLDGLT